MRVMMMNNRKDNKHQQEKEYSSTQFDLTGIWQGDYGKNGIELIEIEYVDNNYVATKITGDDNVPAGKISFFLPNGKGLCLPGNKEIQGYIQIAHRNYESPRFVPGRLKVIDQLNFEFQWSTTVRKFSRFMTSSSSRNGCQYQFVEDVFCEDYK